MFRRLVLMAVSLAFTSPVRRLMSVSLSAMFWRLVFDVGFVDLYSRGQSNYIIIYAHHIRCLVKPLEAATFYPGERFDRQLVNDSRTGLQRGRLNVLRDYQRAGVSTYSNISGTLECQSDAIHIDLHAVIEVNAGRHLVGAIKA